MCGERAPRGHDTRTAVGGQRRVPVACALADAPYCERGAMPRCRYCVTEAGERSHAQGWRSAKTHGLAACACMRLSVRLCVCVCVLVAMLAQTIWAQDGVGLTRPFAAFCWLLQPCPRASGIPQGRTPREDPPRDLPAPVLSGRRPAAPTAQFDGRDRGKTLGLLRTLVGARGRQDEERDGQKGQDWQG